MRKNTVQLSAFLLTVAILLAACGRQETMEEQQETESSQSEAESGQDEAESGQDEAESGQDETESSQEDKEPEGIGQENQADDWAALREQWTATSAQAVEALIDQCRQENMIAILEVHDATGYKDKESLLKADCQDNQIGYIAWSWKGNGGGVEYLDLAEDWMGESLSADWGEVVVNGVNGIRETSQICTVFE